MKRLQIDYRKYNLRNSICYVACLIFIILALLSLPQVGIILPSSQAYFHFRLNQHNSLDNSTDTIADAYVTASSKGGLCTNCKIDFSIALKIYRNATAFYVTNNQTVFYANGWILSNPTEVIFSPQYAYEPCDKLDVNNPPKTINITLNEANNWKTTIPVEFFRSGSHGAEFDFIDANVTKGVNTVHLVSENVIQVNDSSPYVAAVNNEYILGLSLFVIALMCLELRTENKKTEAPKIDTPDTEIKQPSDQLIDKGATYPVGRNKYNSRKHK